MSQQRPCHTQLCVGTLNAVDVRSSILIRLPGCLPQIATAASKQQQQQEGPATEQQGAQHSITKPFSPSCMAKCKREKTKGPSEFQKRSGWYPHTPLQICNLYKVKTRDNYLQKNALNKSCYLPVTKKWQCNLPMHSDGVLGSVLSSNFIIRCFKEECDNKCVLVTQRNHIFLVVLMSTKSTLLAFQCSFFRCCKTQQM